MIVDYRHLYYNYLSDKCLKDIVFNGGWQGGPQVFFWSQKSQQQTFYHDGKALTLYNPCDNVHATEHAPNTIGNGLEFTRGSLATTSRN